MKKVVAMYEQEEAYGKNLAEYVNRKENMPFELQVFSQADKLSDYLQVHTPQLLLLSEESSLESYGEMSVKTQDVLYLTEHKEQARDHKENHIYKYQPTDQLLNQLMQRMSDHDKRDSPVIQESCPIYGVYSPVGRCGKTTFSLLLGELLARKRSVLYIGFDELPFWDEEENISEEQGEKGTLSDAYFYWQRQKLKEKLPVLVSHWHGVDVLTGMNCPEDLCAIQPEEWSQLILKIAQETEYAAIVLDIGSKLWLADSMFSMCSQLYVPVLSERLAKDQQRRFELWLEKNGSDELLQRMQIVTVNFTWYHSAISEMEESFLFTEYLLEHCRSFTSTGETNKMAYELEYILNGKTSDKENLKSTVNSLLLMREGLNLFSAWKDPVLSSQAETAAATLVGWTGVYPAIKLTQFTMIAGWSFAEAIVDVRTLLSGGNIPIIKNSESWTLEFSQIADFLDGDLFLTAKENNGLSYDEYLRLLLYAQGRSDRRYHTMDVIQLRMREKNPDFSMADCLGAVQVKASMKAAPIFYCFAGSGYEISCEQSRMY